MKTPQNTKELINLLRIETACRADNEHTDSGIGGNAVEFLYGLSHQLSAVEVPGQTEDFKWSGNELQVKDSFIKNFSNTKDLKPIRQSYSALVNSDTNFTAKYGKLTFADLNDTDKVSGIIKEESYKDDLQSLFDCLSLTKEMQIVLDAKSDTNLNQDDFALLTKMDEHNDYVRLFCYRTILTIERLVKFNLDEHISPGMSV